MKNSGILALLLGAAFRVLTVPTSSSVPPVSTASGSADQERYVIPNLRNACRILKLLGTQPDGLKAADLARTLGVPVTTTLRIMATLTIEGLVRKVDGRFELGPILIQLGNAALAGTEVRELAIPVLQSLTGATDETSHLAIPCDERALIVAVQDSHHPLRATSRPGFLADLHCSATGKVLLAFLYLDRIESVLAKPAPGRRTAHTLVSPRDLRREAEATRRRGYSLDNEEFSLGVRCLAAPVFSAGGHCVAAVGITASTLRFTEERVPELAEKVRAAAADLSAKLGYPG